MAKKAPSKPPVPEKLQAKTPVATALGTGVSGWDDAMKQRRVKDVASARAIFNKFVIDNSQRSQTFSMTRNQLEGGRPFDPALLKAQGQSAQTNVNFGDAQSDRDKTLLPYWKMINDVPHKAAFTIRSKAPGSDKWAVAFAEAYDDFLTDWGAAYQIEFMNFASNYVNFGPGIVQWRDKSDPRYSAVNVQRIYFPKNGRMSPDEWDVVALVADMSPSELYMKVKDKKSEKQSAYLGWNVDAVKEAIAQFKDGGSMPDPYDYTRWQDMFVNNDIYVSSQFQPLQLVWLYVRNFDGKISCHVFPRMTGDKFLMEDDNYAEKFRHILGPVWYDTGSDSMVHSIKGFAVKNYHFSVLKNRSKSRFVDAGIFSLAINFQRDQDNIPDESPPVENYGGVNVFPTGMKQLAVYPQIQQGASIISMLENNQSQNNSLYRDQQQTEIAETDTAKQAEILASMQSETMQSSASIFLSQYGENVIREQVRRLCTKGNQCEDAKRWVERLKEAGVPEEVIFTYLDKGKLIVSTGANAGMANPAMRVQSFKEGLALSQTPGVNGRWFLENFIANRYGSSSVAKALLPEGEDSMPGQRRAAQQENVDFGQGTELHAIPEDAHFEHLQEHLKVLAPLAMQFRKTQQISPEQTSALIIGLEHSAEHMQFLSQDETMKQQFQQVNGTFREVQSIARGLLMKQAAAQNAAQGQPQLTG